MPTPVVELQRPLLTTRTRRVLVVLSVIGVAAFIGGIAIDATRAWTAVLVNFLFWSRRGHAGVAFCAIFCVTAARWARALKGMAEATVAFLPVAAVMLVILLAGASAWMP